MLLLCMAHAPYCTVPVQVFKIFFIRKTSQNDNAWYKSNISQVYEHLRGASKLLPAKRYSQRAQIISLKAATSNHNTWFISNALQARVHGLQQEELTAYLQFEDPNMYMLKNISYMSHKPQRPPHRRPSCPSSKLLHSTSASSRSGILSPSYIVEVGRCCRPEGEVLSTTGMFPLCASGVY